MLVRSGEALLPCSSPEVALQLKPCVIELCARPKCAVGSGLSPPRRWIASPTFFPLHRHSSGVTARKARSRVDRSGPSAPSQLVCKTSLDVPSIHTRALKPLRSNLRPDLDLPIDEAPHRFVRLTPVDSCSLPRFQSSKSHRHSSGIAEWPTGSRIEPVLADATVCSRHSE
jgi:hypothetical protein